MHRVAKWRDYAIARVRARAAVSYQLGSSAFQRLLVVCYGNIYRSPFVEHCLRAAQGTGVLNVRSAGFHLREGRLVEAGFQDMTRNCYGIDLSLHRSRRVTAADLEWADLVILMDGHNYRMMHDAFPAQLHKCIWLGAASLKTPVIIQDPYKLPPEGQRKIAEQLHVASLALVDRLSRPSGPT